MKYKKSILIIGLGHHARRVYIPALYIISKEKQIAICGVDLKCARPLITEYLLEHKINNIPLLFLKPFNNNLPKDVITHLNKFVDKHKVEGVIIATSPSCHKTYAEWALNKGLHILMDKPITARSYSSTSESQAKKLVEDYASLVQKYEKSFQKKKTAFIVNTQRRYEVGFQYVIGLIKEVAQKFQIPVTSIQAMHADGVWIFPDEIVEQNCHNYYDGHGKCSHSGFHLFDIVWQFYKAGRIPNKTADSAEIYSSFVNPQGLLTQFNQDDYSRLFGDSFYQRKRRSNPELFKIFKNFGENEAFSIIRLLKKNVNICNISINLLHNSFSRRAWPLPAKDLYKGNGRVKHQCYHIQQGPFQCIQIHNYQVKSKQDTNTQKDYRLGGNNHFDIYVFRNKQMFGKKEKALQKFSLKDLSLAENFDDSRLYHEAVKDKIITEFVDLVINGVNRRSELISDIATYHMPVKIMSAIYQSSARYCQKRNPLVKFKINYET